jgi:hypothetical protein
LVPNAVVFTSNLSVLPPSFELSLDNFRSVRKCRLIWRRDDFTGIAFEKYHIGLARSPDAATQIFGT